METQSSNCTSQSAAGCERPDASSEQAVMEVEDVEESQTLAETDDGPEGELSDDKPPEYEELQLEEGAPPIDYDALLAMDQSPKPTDTLMVEAPPSYIQLFGAKELNQVDGVRRTRIRGNRAQRRAHTLSRGRRQREGGNTSPLSSLLSRFSSLNKATVAFIFMAVLLLFLTIPVAMLVIGSLNLHVCSESQVPLYLLIAGFVITAEIIVHSLLCVAAAKCEGSATYRTLRLCDCLAFFLLVWLLIGSNWIFKLTVTGGRNSCELSMDEVTVPSPFDANGTEVIVGTTDYTVTTATSEICDCSRGVYVFTTVVIVMQYILALIVVIGCCSKVWKNTWGSNSD